MYHSGNSGEGGWSWAGLSSVSGRRSGGGVGGGGYGRLVPRATVPRGNFRAVENRVIFVLFIYTILALRLGLSGTYKSREYEADRAI